MSATNGAGKYLRAPDIYHLIVRKGAPVLTKLVQVADIQGYIHDNNTGAEFPQVDFLKSVKNADTIHIGRNSPGVIRYGVKKDGNSRLVASILFPRTFGSRHIIVWNPDGVFGKEFYKVIIDSPDLAMSVAAQLNSTFGILQREILGLVTSAMVRSSSRRTMWPCLRSLSASHTQTWPARSSPFRLDRCWTFRRN